MLHSYNARQNPREDYVPLPCDSFSVKTSSPPILANIPSGKVWGRKRRKNQIIQADCPRQTWVGGLAERRSRTTRSAQFWAVMADGTFSPAIPFSMASRAGA